MQGGVAAGGSQEARGVRHGDGSHLHDGTNGRRKGRSGRGPPFAPRERGASSIGVIRQRRAPRWRSRRAGGESSPAIGPSTRAWRRPSTRSSPSSAKRGASWTRSNSSARRKAQRPTSQQVTRASAKLRERPRRGAASFKTHPAKYAGERRVSGAAAAPDGELAGGGLVGVVYDDSRHAVTANEAARLRCSLVVARR